MKQYQELLHHVINYGDEIEGRNGKVKELHGETCRYDDIGGKNSFPVITTKKMSIRTIIAEMICFIRGYVHVSDFKSMGVNFWDENAFDPAWRVKVPESPSGYMGRIYGAQWRTWKKIDEVYTGDNDVKQTVSYVDQLSDLVKNIRSDPYSRRHVVTAWNPGEINAMCLPPCHMFFQVLINSENELDLIMYQRSCDMFLGVPFNITSYCILMLILCHQTGCTPGSFIHNMGSVHMYEEHYDQCKTMLNRLPLMLPTVFISRKDVPENISDYNVDDFTIEDYSHYPAIKGDMVL